MALTHSTSIRNRIADLVVDSIDVAASPGTLKIYHSDGTTVLATLTFSVNAFGSASSGVATANSISTSNATAAGTATTFRIFDSTSTEILRGSVTTTGGGGDLTITNTSIAINDPISVSSLTYTAPN